MNIFFEGCWLWLLGKAWAIPIQSQQFPPLHGSRRFTTALPAEVGIAHEDIAALQTAALRRQRGRLRVRRWARPKWWGDWQGSNECDMWSDETRQTSDVTPSLDLGRTASISPFNLTEICRHWANHWKYWKLDVDIIIWDFQKKTVTHEFPFLDANGGT